MTVRRRSDEGTSAVLGLLIGMTVFVGSFIYVVNVAVDTDPDIGAAAEGRLSLSAKSLAEVLMQPGSGWEGDPEDLGVYTEGTNVYTYDVPSGALYPGLLCPYEGLGHRIDGDGFADGDGVYETGEVNTDGIDSDSGRFGLGADPCDPGLVNGGRNHLSFWKFQNLFNAEDNRAENTNVDYQSARASLGMDEAGLGFHIRSSPVMASARELLRTTSQDETMKPLYIGNYIDNNAHGGGHDEEEEESVVYSELEYRHVEPPGTASGPARAILEVEICNNGETPTVFQVTFSPRTSHSMSFSAFTPLMGVNPTGTDCDDEGNWELVSAPLLKSSDWTWATTGQEIVAYTITDSDGGENLASDEIDVSLAHLGSHGAVQNLLYVEAGGNSFAPSDDPVELEIEVHVSAYAGNGQGARFDRNGADPPTLHMYELDGDELGDELTGPFGATTLPKTWSGNTRHAEVTLTFSGASMLAAGEYRIQLENDAGTVIYDQDIVNVVDELEAGYTPAVESGEPSEGVPPDEDYTPTDTTATESNFLELLMSNFDRDVAVSDYASSEIPDDLLVDGDVFPADKQELNGWLDAVLEEEYDPSNPDHSEGHGSSTLETYTTIVVGSDVDQTVMNSANVKWTIQRWVEAGGSLIVLGSLGSDREHNQWLNPVYDASADSASTGLYTPDEDHPLLNVPNELDYTSYEEISTWSIDDDQPFTSVVQTDDGGNILAAANAGGVGKGRVILTGWRPAMMRGEEDPQCAADAFEPPGTAPNCEGLFLLHNLVAFSYHELYLDYGPAIPTGEETGFYMRLASLYHPEVGRSFAVKLQVFVFPQG